MAQNGNPGDSLLGKGGGSKPRWREKYLGDTTIEQGGKEGGGVRLWERKKEKLN